MRIIAKPPHAPHTPRPQRPPTLKRVRIKNPRTPNVKTDEGPWSGGDVKQTYTK